MEEAKATASGGYDLKPDSSWPWCSHTALVVDKRFPSNASSSGNAGSMALPVFFIVEVQVKVLNEKIVSCVTNFRGFAYFSGLPHKCKQININFKSMEMAVGGVLCAGKRSSFVKE